MKNAVHLCLAFLVSTLIAFASPAPQSAENVFQFSATRLDPNAIQLKWHIKPGYFLYQNRIMIENLSPEQLLLAPLHFPQSLHKSDPINGTYGIYRNNLSLTQPLSSDTSGSLPIRIHYQGCADRGYCYPPMQATLQLQFNGKQGLQSIEIQTASKPEKTESNPLFAGKSIALILLGFFGLGLLLSFTPCVLPMIPILSGIILGQGKEATTRHAFSISCVYVLSMSLTYAAIGVGVALLGHNLQASLQTPLAISGFALLSVLLALAMFGCYDLNLPLPIQQWLARMTGKQHGGTYLGVVIMGSLSSLVLSPCVTPALVGALSYITTTGDLWLGSCSLFFLGLGMGAPLILLSVGAKHYLPKAGYWMNNVKALFGFLLLGLAILLLQRILPGHVILGLFGVLVIFMAYYYRSDNAFAKGFCFVGLVYGTVLLVGASLGHHDPLQPLSPSPILSESAPKTSSAPLTLATLQEAIQHSQDPVLLRFTANWCIECQIMDKTIWSQPDINKLLTRTTQLTIDLTEINEQTQAIMTHYGVIAPPTLLFLNTKGEELSHCRVIGDISKKEFIARYQRCRGEATDRG